MKPPMIVRQVQQHGGVQHVTPLTPGASKRGGSGARRWVAEVVCQDGWSRPVTAGEARALVKQGKREAAEAEPGA